MKKHTFTLVEIVMVIALIGVLTALAVGGYSYAMGSAKESATRAIIKQAEAALENVRAKHGFYLPMDAQSAGGGKIYVMDDDGNADAEEVTEQWLEKNLGLSGNKLQEQKKVFQPAVADFLKTLDVESLREYVDDDGALCDAWGAPLVYKAPDKDLKKNLTIRSHGPDEIIDDDDDLLNN